MRTTFLIDPGSRSSAEECSWSVARVCTGWTRGVLSLSCEGLFGGCLGSANRRRRVLNAICQASRPRVSKGRWLLPVACLLEPTPQRGWPHRGSKRDQRSILRRRDWRGFALLDKQSAFPRSILPALSSGFSRGRDCKIPRLPNAICASISRRGQGEFDAAALY
jgi:hypothetical protein